MIKMSQYIGIRMPETMVKVIDSLVEKKIFRSRTRAIEQFVHEGLEKRNLINYEETQSKKEVYSHE